MLLRRSMPGDTFDFSGYETWRESHEVVAVRLRFTAQSADFGVYVSCEQRIILPQDQAEPPPMDAADSARKLQTTPAVSKLGPSDLGRS
jgi:hypothetical protein